MALSGFTFMEIKKEVEEILNISEPIPGWILITGLQIEINLNNY
jgi:hypothetical protein